MTIQVAKVWTDNEFAQVWHVDDDGQLVCQHENIEHDPGENGDWSEPTYGPFDYCGDCGQVIEA